MLSNVEALIRQDRWVEARRVILARLRSDPDNHWLVGRLGLTYYEQRQYKRALEHATHAVALMPRCPLALWDYAGSLQMLDRDAQAVDIYRGLIRRGVKRIASGPCGEGMARARGLIADCHLRLSDSLSALRRDAEAMRHFAKHLDMRGPGCQSIYSLKDTAKRRIELARPHAAV